MYAVRLLGACRTASYTGIQQIAQTTAKRKHTIDYSRVPVLVESDLEESFVKGSGPGGQSVNKTVNCVVLSHKSSGIVIKCHESRLLSQNRKLARQRMVEKLDEYYNGDLSVAAQKKIFQDKKNLEHNRRRKKLQELKRAWKEREGD